MLFFNFWLFPFSKFQMTIVKNLIMDLQQSVTDYMWLTLVFVLNNTLRKSLIAVFWKFFASIDKTFIFAGGLDTSLSFYEVYTIS